MKTKPLFIENVHAYYLNYLGGRRRRRRIKSRPSTVIFGLHPVTPLAHVQLQAQNLCRYIIWEGWILCHITTLTMKMELASETTVYLNQLRQLSAQEDFIEFSHCEHFKTCFTMQFN
jgi:hypothetical protein